jgi:serine/threonine protein phosphatase PrpC
MTPLRIAGDTNVGKVRETNEDSMIVEPQLGLYAVLDGMGGANAGDVASQMARDAIREFVAHRRLTMEPRQLLENAIQHATATVFAAAAQNRERHGMGTTCVACIVVDPRRIVIAHVGDSRAYLLRGGRLQMLTKDHTIVEELVERGLLTAEEANVHPYKNVLSRNIGARPETRPDVVEVEVKPGDRLLLCSDGLYGYASAEAMQYLLGSGDDPQHVARDLIDLALRGGGGDNVSTIVIEAPAAASQIQVVQTQGAQAWWQHRQRFLQVARERGLATNPICRGLQPDEALELVGLSLCQAIYHDLEKSTGVNVWTFAQNVASGWFERNGNWLPLRGLMDILAMSARTVVDEIRVGDQEVGFLVDVAVSRALVVAELALGGLLAERLREVEVNLISAHAAAQETLDQTADETPKFLDQVTIPFLAPDRPVTNTGVSAELLGAIGKALTIARARTAPRAELVKQVLSALDAIASDDAGSFGAAVIAAREIYGIRSLDEAGVIPLYDALDNARIITASSVQQIDVTPPTRALVLRAISMAHQRLVGAVTGLVLEGVLPVSESLRNMQARTTQMRDRVARAERKRAELEKNIATSIDQSLPWENRGNTEW